jgi:hypothetical protein
MRHLLLAALTALFTATAAPAFAASMIFDVLFSGTVASDVTSGPPVPIVFGQNLAGKPVHVSESFNLANAVFSDVLNYFGGSNFASAKLTIGNVSASFQGQAGSFGLGLGGFSTSVFTKGPGDDETGLYFSNRFDTIQHGFVADGSLFLLTGPSIRNIDFNIKSETLVLSPVPLPPALPLFAAALLALGIVSYARRAKDVRPAHGQAY